MEGLSGRGVEVLRRGLRDGGVERLRGGGVEGFSVQDLVSAIESVGCRCNGVPAWGYGASRIGFRV